MAFLTDIYPILKYVDILVTDYSSLLFDYLLCGGPIIFYQPDHSDYITQRPLIDGYEQYICGDVVSDIGQLIVTLEGTVEILRQTQNDPYKQKRRVLRQMCFDQIDGKASERVCELIMRSLE